MILWLESFDYFGGDKTKMFDGLWSQLDNEWDLSNTRARTGTYSLKMTGNATGSATYQARRAFGGAKTTVGIGFASYLTGLPISNDVFGISFRDTANVEQFALYIQSTGIIEAKKRSSPASPPDISLGDTGVPVVTANAWHHIEIKAVASNSAGAIEVRVNEVTRLNLTGIDNIQTTNIEFSQVFWGDDSSLGANADWYLDDIFAWDDTVDGTNDVVDFIGDKKVFTSLPNADTAQADFAKSSGVTGYTLIDETSPDDADYISSDTDATSSDFGLTDLPGEVVEIIAVMPLPRLYKSDAGTVTHAADIVSNGDVTAADPIPATTQPTYWPFVHTKDPDTGVPFTPSGFNASLLRVTRA